MKPEKKKKKWEPRNPYDTKYCNLYRFEIILEERIL